MKICEIVVNESRKPSDRRTVNIFPRLKIGKIPCIYYANKLTFCSHKQVRGRGESSLHVVILQQLVTDVVRS
jgi:hypothetical protein